MAQVAGVRSRPLNPEPIGAVIRVREIRSIVVQRLYHDAIKSEHDETVDIGRVTSTDELVELLQDRAAEGLEQVGEHGGKWYTRVVVNVLMYQYHRERERQGAVKRKPFHFTADDRVVDEFADKPFEWQGLQNFLDQANESVALKSLPSLDSGPSAPPAVPSPSEPTPQAPAAPPAASVAGDDPGDADPASTAPLDDPLAPESLAGMNPDLLDELTWLDFLGLAKELGVKGKRPRNVMTGEMREKMLAARA